MCDCHIWYSASASLFILFIRFKIASACYQQMLYEERKKPVITKNSLPLLYTHYLTEITVLFSKKQYSDLILQVIPAHHPGLCTAT